MEIHILALSLLALFGAAADIFIRLRLAPHRRDTVVVSMMDMLCADRVETFTKAVSAVQLETDVANSLLKHFEQSFASPLVVAALAETSHGITEKELEMRFTEMTKRRGEPPLPSSALRKVVTILMTANFVNKEGGMLKMTELGRALHALLQNRHRI